MNDALFSSQSAGEDDGGRLPRLRTDSGPNVDWAVNDLNKIRPRTEELVGLLGRIGAGGTAEFSAVERVCSLVLASELT